MIIVVRYFGGTKLGIQGLIRSYKTAASDAISKVKIITKIIHDKYQFFFKYSDLNQVMKIVKDFKLDVQKTDFDIDCNITLLVPRKISDQVLDLFKKKNMVRVEYKGTT